MKPLPLILGLIVGFILIAFLLKKPDPLVADPQEKMAEQTEKNQREQAIEDAKRIANAPIEGLDEFKPNKEGVIKTTLKIKDKGSIVIELYPKEAPKTVAQISGLIQKGFYNGIRIHRVDTGYVIQFGIPGTKTSWPDFPKDKPGLQTFPFEVNNLKNIRSTLAIALKENEKDSGDSEIFINLVNNKHLNGGYCVFGRIVEGLDVAGKIAIGDVIDSFSITPR